MIPYNNAGVLIFFNLFKFKGSVFPKALALALPSTVASVTFVHILRTHQGLGEFEKQDSIMSNNAIWGGFSFALGFLVIFRTSQAYSRFWEGCTNMHKMGAEWYDACAALMAFTKHSDRPPQAVMRFQNMLVRLFSMLHSAACGEIEESSMGYESLASAMGAFDMELIDAESITDETLLAVQNCDAKTELIMQWIQQFIVENIKTGVLSIPPPILSRSFQEIATGMVHFNEALKIANVPFPFPYAQTCDMLLVLHWFVVPFVVSQWVMKPWWAGIFAFIMVFTLWTLNFIAIQLENPFGCDANDIDGPRMQKDMNNHLRVLLREETWNTPSFKSESKSEEQELVEQEELRWRATAPDDHEVQSFTRLWKNLHGGGTREFIEEASVRHAPVGRFRATVNNTTERKTWTKKSLSPKSAKAMQSAPDIDNRNAQPASESRQSVQIKRQQERDPTPQSVQTLNGNGQSLTGNAQPTTGNAQTLIENTQSLNGTGVPETAVRSLVANGDQDQTMACRLLGRDASDWDARNCPELPGMRGLAVEVPALVPRVLSQDIAATPRGRGSLPDGEGVATPLTARSSASGEPRTLSQRPVLMSGPPSARLSKGRGRGIPGQPLPLAHVQLAINSTDERSSPQLSSRPSSQRQWQPLSARQDRTERQDV